MNIHELHKALLEPARAVLAQHGIQFRTTHKGGATWYDLSKCPLCGLSGYQCAITETIGADGKLRHEVQCRHGADDRSGAESPEYEDLLYKIGAIPADESDGVKRVLLDDSYPRGRSAQCSYCSSDEELLNENLGPVNAEYLAVLKKRLRENKDALRYLTEDRGLTMRTIERFDLGLAKPYTNTAGEIQGDALLYPVRGRFGKPLGKYGYYNVPGVTKSPAAENGWMSGSARTYYADARDGRRRLFVCEEAKDVWRHWQALQGSTLFNDFLLITSSHESAFPDAWKNPFFWAGWDVIYFGHDNTEASDQTATALALLIGKEARRVQVPRGYGKDWTDFWQSGGTLEEFLRLLDDAPAVSQEVRTGEGAGDVLGRFTYDPVDINGAYHNGHLYCTVQTLHREVDLMRNETDDEVVGIVERLETVVVRSDRTVHTTMWAKSPRGTKQQDRVLRLSDGTLITREPQPNKYSTWTWPSIKTYLDSESKTRHLAEILRDCTTYLKASVWLPYEEDYALLALTVPVTYTQSVFDSVPLLFLNGPAGSGKSQMGRAMARVCANAYVCGQSSAASIARLIDESRGFVVLDDLEVIGSRGGEFSELVQGLKQSYNKETAVKLWTDVKTMRTERLNFFGVKMVNNTQGADQILGSRMLRIQTRKVPEHLKQEFSDLKPTDSLKVTELRNELHTWAFEHVAEVDAEYKRLYPKGTNRADEIAAPLQVFASLAGEPELKSRLDVALTRQKHKTFDTDDPIQVMREALKNLVAQGYHLISITHLVLEMRSLIHENRGKSFANELPEWARPEWVGRMLRTHDLIDPDSGKAVRIRLFGANLRFYPIHPGYIEEVRRRFAAQGATIQTSTQEPTAFCCGCDICPYANHNCEIMPKRLRFEGREATVRTRLGAK